jgi:hypothetical protein
VLPGMRQPSRSGGVPRAPTINLVDPDYRVLDALNHDQAPGDRSAFATALMDARAPDVLYSSAPDGAEIADRRPAGLSSCARPEPTRPRSC